MPGLVPGTHVFPATARDPFKTWMTGTSPVKGDERRGVAMKTYRGGRSLDGAVVTVTEDGHSRPLAPRHDLRRMSLAGFEWTYEGAGPAQLALALLADHLGDDTTALQLYAPFMRALVAALDNSWELSSADIDAALAELRR